MAESACDLLDLATIAKIQRGGFLICTHLRFTADSTDSTKNQCVKTMSRKES